MACGGDSGTICGGSYGLSLYSLTNGVGGYVGCAVDNAGFGLGRTLPGAMTNSPDMTVQKCLDFCGGSSQYVGLEYGTECYCGSPSDITIGASGCNTKCGGDPTQVCGGNWKLSVYKNAAYVPPVVKSTIQGYSYQGCYVDSFARVLGSYVSASEQMTQDTCVGVCKSRGLPVAGVEYGRECWCGRQVPLVKAADPNAECSMKCEGDATQLCGGGLRMNVWSSL